MAPDLAPKVHLHDGKLSAFEEHRVVEQIHKALDKKVWLPSGGYLFIERTEAMTIIVDEPETLALADRLGITVVARAA